MKIGRALAFNPILGKIQSPTLSRVLDLSINDILLDIGCGSGWFTWRAAKISTAIGLDINLRLLKKFALVKNCPRNFHFLVADALHLPLKEKTVSKILLGGTLQVIEAEDKLLKEHYRVLKSDGLLVVTAVTQHILIKRIYNARINLIKHLFKWFKYPKSYANFIDEQVCKLKMTKYHTVDELKRFLSKNGFRLVNINYAPKNLSSSIIDLLLLLLYRWFPSVKNPICFLLYPYIHVADRLGDGSGGNFVIMVARKV